MIVEVIYTSWWCCSNSGGGGEERSKNCRNRLKEAAGGALAYLRDALAQPGVRLCSNQLWISTQQ